MSVQRIRFFYVEGEGRIYMRRGKEAATEIGEEYSGWDSESMQLLVDIANGDAANWVEIPEQPKEPRDE